MITTRTLTRGVLAFPSCAAAILSAACATAPPPAPPVVTLEQKTAWMLQLEDQRILRLDPPAPPPAAPARGRRVEPPAPSSTPDLTVLATDADPRVRRRAAIALGRVGLKEGLPPLLTLLADADPDVRAMAAFGLGLVGDVSAAAPLTGVLADANPSVSGRAAEALGLIGAKESAGEIGTLAARLARVPAVASMSPDDETWPSAAPEADALRLALTALVRLRAYDPLAAAVLEGGRPVTRWWPVAFALQRLGDARAKPALVDLLSTQGTYTRAFAARGLGTLKDPSTVDLLLPLVAPGRVPREVVVSAIRALAQIGDQRGAQPLVAILTAPDVEDNLRLEAVTALGAMRSQEALPVIQDLMTDDWAAMRIQASRAAASVDPDAFVMTLASLDPDRDWIVRAAIADILGTLPAGVAVVRLRSMLGDQDKRVLPSVLRALVRHKVPDAASIVTPYLGDPDYALRAAVATLVGQLKPEGGAALLREAVKTAQPDSAYDARVAALSALAEYGAAEALDTLKAALADKDWAVRRRARDLLDRLAPGEDHRTTIRPAPGSPPAPYDDPALVAPPNSPHVFIETTRGTIEFELSMLDAPQTSRNFVRLASNGFFNGLRIHRVVPNFVVQDGDPRGDGGGGPGYTIRDELNARPFLRGAVGMALAGPDTGGSQFFITHSPQPHLDAQYTVFGHVVNGMDVVDRIRQGDTIDRIRVWDGKTWQ